MKAKLNCFLDGDAVCIVKKDFIDLQESEAMFITLTKKQLKEFKELIKDEEDLEWMRQNAGKN